MTTPKEIRRARRVRMGALSRWLHRIETRLRSMLTESVAGSTAHTPRTPGRRRDSDAARASASARTGNCAVAQAILPRYGHCLELSWQHLPPSVFPKDLHGQALPPWFRRRRRQYRHSPAGGRIQGTAEEIEQQWFKQVYRGRGDVMRQLTWRAVVMGSCSAACFADESLHR